MLTKEKYFDSDFIKELIKYLVCRECERYRRG